MKAVAGGSGNSSAYAMRMHAMESSRYCAYTKRQARRLYEEHRKTVVARIDIKEVQQRVIGKITGTDDSVDVMLSSIRDMRSYDGIMNTADDSMQNISDYDALGTIGNACDDQQRMIYHDEVIEDGSMLGGMHMNGEHDNVQKKRRRKNRFVDDEADVSGEDSGTDEEYESSRDEVSELVASDGEESNELHRSIYNEDALRRNERMLKALHDRFFGSPVGRMKIVSHDAHNTLKVCASKAESLNAEESEDGSQENSYFEELDDAENSLVFPSEDVEYSEDACRRQIHHEYAEVEFIGNANIVEKKLGNRNNVWEFSEKHE
ncbi:hypothetical protein HK407_08g13060 [Ordospora pajunii]|jgi:hypothetical protein|uniref:uncharacterized protein n=1 Tax=Ordospora pajunii TaxID=3039483 RepID=UPI0029528349|nr:uncharacterized protein HK407_08g13060 [Ordospora pajunii]KAH9411161.1 hypothetical protein HK407_08g13060 [Ordospora pajunii]